MIAHFSPPARAQSCIFWSFLTPRLNYGGHTQPVHYLLLPHKILDSTELPGTSPTPKLTLSSEPNKPQAPRNHKPSPPASSLPKEETGKKDRHRSHQNATGKPPRQVLLSTLQDGSKQNFCKQNFVHINVRVRGTLLWTPLEQLAPAFPSPLIARQLPSWLSPGPPQRIQKYIGRLKNWPV